ncbi:hypothetical protein ACQP00_17765 [Dactylosporangium sp. CS-047395]|uniref:hypothetical protein n=1 Tax=Dactylosporangium sp. CS-047395 TaxID=3239936 RepID=UPI003D8BCD4E
MTPGGDQTPVGAPSLVRDLEAAGPEPLTLGRGRLWITWHEAERGRAGLHVGTKPLLNPVLEEHLPAVAGLVAELGRAWEADYAWIDLVHVREEWNRPEPGAPVFSLATWLRTTAARTDTDGLDVDVTDTGDGRLIVLRLPPAAVGNDEDGTVSGGRALVQALAANTVRPGAGPAK